jgi:hypothetical protein
MKRLSSFHIVTKNVEKRTAKKPVPIPLLPLPRKEMGESDSIGHFVWRQQIVFPSIVSQYFVNRSTHSKSLENFPSPFSSVDGIDIVAGSSMQKIVPRGRSFRDVKLPNFLWTGAEQSFKYNKWAVAYS